MRLTAGVRRTSGGSTEMVQTSAISDSPVWATTTPRSPAARMRSTISNPRKTLAIDEVVFMAASTWLALKTPWFCSARTV